MKISKSLLKSIALGVTLGALGTSCTSNVFAPILDEEVERDATTEREHGTDTCHGDWEDCPACGLG